jgi:glycine hydroxymethyltransferase
MAEKEMARIAALLAGGLRGEVESVPAREEVRDLVGGFPPYPA